MMEMGFYIPITTARAVFGLLSLDILNKNV